MIEVPRRQMCACGAGCDDRSSVKWNGYLVVTCVPDEEAMSLVEAIMEAARRSIADERAAVVAYLRELAEAAGNRDLYWQGVASGNGYAAQMIERGEHRKESP